MGLLCPFTLTPLLPSELRLANTTQHAFTAKRDDEQNDQEQQ